MNFSAEKVEYKDTGFFPKIVIDYLAADEKLKAFYKFSADLDGIRYAVNERKNFPVDRQLLVSVLQNDYKSSAQSEKLRENIAALVSENTFTVCTAHQPNIFTGRLYFIYKILHAVRLSDELNTKFPENKFVPVYYMGSEDADLDELGEISVEGKNYRWNTEQTGAVGRMKIDQSFIKLIDELQSQLLVKPFGPEVTALINNSYKPGEELQNATFKFVHALFNEFGLVILLPDNAALKKKFVPVIAKELSENFSEKLVAETVAQFPTDYKVQASGRDINLFYLKDNIRKRIEKKENNFFVSDTELSFSHDEMQRELEQHPERFSPNVILRPLYQETILPNIVFIGGGGELAYWLELKEVFTAANVFLPVLLLRNSFGVSSRPTVKNVQSLKLSATEIFMNDHQILSQLVKRKTGSKTELIQEKNQLRELYASIKKYTLKADPSLGGHTEALLTQALNKLDRLEIKMLRAAKRKLTAEHDRVGSVKNQLFPLASLQERVENVLPFYSMYGREFLKAVYDHSEIIPAHFTLLNPQ